MPARNVGAAGTRPGRAGWAVANGGQVRDAVPVRSAVGTGRLAAAHLAVALLSGAGAAPERSPPASGRAGAGCARPAVPRRAGPPSPAATASAGAARRRRQSPAPGGPASRSRSATARGRVAGVPFRAWSGQAAGCRRGHVRPGRRSGSSPGGAEPRGAAAAALPDAAASGRRRPDRARRGWRKSVRSGEGRGARTKQEHKGRAMSTPVCLPVRSTRSVRGTLRSICPVCLVAPSTSSRRRSGTNGAMATQPLTNSTNAALRGQAGLWADMRSSSAYISLGACRSIIECAVLFFWKEQRGLQSPDE